jgi:hypothetical protein
LFASTTGGKLYTGDVEEGDDDAWLCGDKRVLVNVVLCEGINTANLPLELTELIDKGVGLTMSCALLRKDVEAIICGGVEGGVGLLWERSRVDVVRRDDAGRALDVVMLNGAEGTSEGLGVLAERAMNERGEDSGFRNFIVTSEVTRRGGFLEGRDDIGGVEM